MPDEIEELCWFEVDAISKYSDKKTCLDIGTGTGTFTKFFKEKFLVGIDLDITRLKKIRKTQNLILADASHLPFKGATFEFVLANQVIEHLYQYQINDFIEDVERTLKINGTFVITTPNSGKLANFANKLILQNRLFGFFWRILMGRDKHLKIPKKDDENLSGIHTHNTLFTGKMLENLGFSVKGYMRINKSSKFEMLDRISRNFLFISPYLFAILTKSVKEEDSNHKVDDI